MDLIPTRTAALLLRLTELLDLTRLSQPPRLELWPGILPVVDLSGIVRTPKAATVTLNLSGAAGTYTTAFVVPEKKRWTLKAIYRSVSGPNLLLRIGGVNYIFSYTVGSATIARPVPLEGVRISAGDEVGSNTDGLSGAVVHDLFYEEEDTP